MNRKLHARETEGIRRKKEKHKKETKKNEGQRNGEPRNQRTKGNRTNKEIEKYDQTRLHPYDWARQKKNQETRFLLLSTIDLHQSDIPLHFNRNGGRDEFTKKNKTRPY